MITWLKYPENKPEKKEVYLVWGNGEWDYIEWGGLKWNHCSFNVTHFTEINPPQPDIVQPSTEGC